MTKDSTQLDSDNNPIVNTSPVYNIHDEFDKLDNNNTNVENPTVKRLGKGDTVNIFGELTKSLKNNAPTDAKPTISSSGYAIMNTASVVFVIAFVAIVLLIIGFTVKDSYNELLGIDNNTEFNKVYYEEGVRKSFSKLSPTMSLKELKITLGQPTIVQEVNGNELYQWDFRDGSIFYTSDGEYTRLYINDRTATNNIESYDASGLNKDNIVDELINNEEWGLGKFIDNMIYDKNTEEILKEYNIIFNNGDVINIVMDDNDFLSITVETEAGIETLL